MIKYNLKLIFRKIKNNKIFPAVNLIGLTIGLTCSILAFLYIQYEIGYNKDFKETQNIYRVTANNFGGTDFGSGEPVRFLNNILAEIPEVKSAVRLNGDNAIVKIREDNFKVDDYIYTDSNFFSFFHWPLIAGQPDKVLSTPNTAVVSESKAKEWFGDKNPVGKVIKIDQYLDVTITGVFRDFSKQSSIKADIIASLSTKEKNNSYMFESWGWFSSEIYVQLDGKSDVAQVNKKIKNLWNTVSEGGGARGENIRFILQPFSEIYLKSGYLSNDSNNSMIVFGIGALALFILVIACFNFINLSIALAGNQNIEAGIQKTMGAGRLDFGRQVFLEVVIYLVVALLISSLIISSVINPIGHFINKDLTFNILTNIPLLLFLVLICIILTIGTGILPLMNLLRNQTTNILKGVKVQPKTKIAGIAIKGNLRNTLVIIQFTFGIILILSAIIVNKQLRLIREKDAGFDKEQVMVIINNANKGDQVFNNLKQALSKYPEVSLVTSANNVPTDGIWNWGTPKVVGQDWKEVENCGYVSVNYEYFKAIGAEFLMGRDFITDQASENQKIIITESLMKRLDLQNPIGYKLTQLWDDTDREIVGVVKDIEFKDIHNKRSPILFFCRNKNLGWYPKIIIKMKSANLSNTIDHVKTEWKLVAPDWPIDYFFLNEKFEANYTKEKQVAAVVNGLTWIAIFLCCLGLFGLALFNINSRIKEIGIRKVNGAKESEIMLLINKEFIVWIMTGYIIAVPFSLLMMNKWLSGFAYRTDIPWWAILMSGLIAFSIALLTVSWQSWRAATRNPVEALRYE